MENKKLKWHSFASEIEHELGVKLTVESLRIIKTLKTIEKSYFEFGKYRTAKTILTKIALSICGHRLKYKVYSNQIKPIRDKAGLSANTKESYNKVYRLIKRIFGSKWNKKILIKTFRNREWLYDLHWYRDLNYLDKNPFAKVESDEDRFIPKYLSLVAEIEYSRKNKGGKLGNIRYDFQKLLVANAELRLMVFKNKGKNDLEFISSYFIHAINSYSPLHLPIKSKFLFAVFDELEETLSFSYFEKTE